MWGGGQCDRVLVDRRLWGVGQCTRRDNRLDELMIVGRYLAVLEIRPFLQSGTAKKCAGMATFVISHSDELANLRPTWDKGHF